MKQEIDINGKKIGSAHPPYIIAEISGNHDGDLNKALKLIELAKDCGADAVKFQTYLPDSLTIDSDHPAFMLTKGIWKGKNLYKLYSEAHTPWEWFPKLFDAAKKANITAFSTPFDKNAVKYLAEFNMPVYKVASNEFTDWPLIKEIAACKKPIILSTGVATKQEISETIEYLRALHVKDIIILHCVSSYPALASEANVSTLKSIRDECGVLTGFSDHSLSLGVALSAVASGACVIEKHFTLSRADNGPDSAFSIEPQELKQLCTEVRNFWSATGHSIYGGDTNLKEKNIFTRQFWSIKDIRIGELLDEHNIKSIRAPADAGGVGTKNFQKIYGKKAINQIPKHVPILWSMLEQEEL